MAYVPFKKMRMESAIENGNLGKVRALLDKGVDPNFSDTWASLLCYAVLKKKKDIAELMIEYGADTGKIFPAGSCLHIAVKTADAEMVTFLLGKNPALVKTRDSAGNTPLHLAAKNGYEDVAVALLLKGADSNAKNNEHRTPLQLASREGHREVATILAPVTELFTGAKKMAAVPVLSLAEEWKKLSPKKIAYIEIDKDIGYKTTTIFNFESRERIRIVHNLQTKTDAPSETKEFDEIRNKQSLEKALAELDRQGGTAVPGSISGIIKDRPPAV